MNVASQSDLQNQPPPLFISVAQNAPRASLLSLLTPHECAEYDLVVSDKEYHWLLGRAAAKHAVRNLLKQIYDIHLDFLDIELTSRKNAAPKVRFLHPAPNVNISISHSRGLGAAQASVYGTRVGIDVERIRSFPQNVADAFLTKKEKELSSRSTLGRDTEATLRWSVKEAYGKALGLGLRLNPRRVEVVLGNGTCALNVDGAPAYAKAYWTIKNDVYILVSIQL
jgi:phosphopantetheinyl transferase